MWAIIIGDETGKLWLANNQKDEVIWLEVFDMGAMVEVYYVIWFWFHIFICNHLVHVGYDLECD